LAATQILSQEVQQLKSSMPEPPDNKKLFIQADEEAPN